MRRIFLDCDGVLVDPRRHAVEILGLPVDWTIPGQQYEFEDWIPEHADAVRKLMSTPEFWLTLPAVDGAQAGVQRLRDRNAEITVVTSPYKGCPMWYDARVELLSNLFGIGQDDIILAKKKYKVTNADVFIDDWIGHVTEWENAQHNGRAFLFDAPHNAFVARLQRVSWDTIDRVF